MRLIDADKYPCKGCTTEFCFNVCGEFWKWLETPENAEPVRHGRWINKTEERHGIFDYRFDCSVCRHIFWAGGVENFNYCPNCGAKMDDGK